jgi:hypothetical protein
MSQTITLSLAPIPITIVEKRWIKQNMKFPMENILSRPEPLHGSLQHAYPAIRCLPPSVKIPQFPQTKHGPIIRSTHAHGPVVAGVE